MVKRKIRNLKALKKKIKKLKFLSTHFAENGKEKLSPNDYYI